MTGSNPDSVDMSKIVRGCPCFKDTDGEQLCMNQDRVIDVEFIPIDPDLLSHGSIGSDLPNETNNTICFQLLRINTRENKLVCVSRGQDLVIRNNLVDPSDLTEAVEMLTGRSHISHANICNECLYGVLDRFQIRNTQMKLM